MITQNVDLCTQLPKGTKLNTELIIYPNPFNTNITFNSELNQTIEIINLIGSLVYSAKTENEKTEIDLSNLQNGIYFVKVGSVVNKIIKE